MVTVILGEPPAGIELDEADRLALRVLADSGLLPPLRLTPAAPEASEFQTHRAGM
ncbi:hypothetical protein [Actinopolymorpha alba]|uniref:hypothetical protein n=1 Tax=Actinopolymorpha alba TaxID=533267 RepID=UPI00037E35A8|nr:hypothetical protein [Actinopolymorpha alba]